VTRAGSDGAALPLQADAPSRRRFCTALNPTRRTAGLLGIAVPQSVVLRADAVIG
jgi:hypothetical protein